MSKPVKHRPESQKQKDAFEEFIRTGANAGDKNLGEIGAKFGVSKTTIENWYSWYNWKQRAMQRELAIRQEVYDAVDQLKQDWQRILAARQDVILAGQTYEAEKRQFEVGLRTSTEVLEAAARLASAQSREIRALASYEVSQVDIAFATGTLLGHGRITWEPIGLD